MTKSDVSGTQEDYLETIYEILRTRKVARVRDIAETMGVRPASVTPAMKRLADKHLITYAKREYIELTEEGMELARSTLAKHKLLARFFTDILGVESDAAQRDACLMEHNLSSECMDKLTRFFECFSMCPVPFDSVIARMMECPVFNPDSGISCPRGYSSSKATPPAAAHKLVEEMQVGEVSTVVRVLEGTGNRLNLLEKGFVPGSEVRLIRRGSDDLTYIVLLDGYEVEVTNGESSFIVTAIQ